VELPTFAELLPFFIAIVIASGIAGFLAGLFGIGGGAILVPLFYQVLTALEVDEAIRMHISVGSSLAIIIPTSLRSFAGHRAKNAVDMDYLKSMAAPVVIGVGMASFIAAYISGRELQIIFAVCVFVIGFKLIFGKDGWKLADDIPTGWIRNLAGWAIGFFSTFMGIGGGVFNNTFMTSFSRPIHQAIATSSGMGVLISIPGVIVYIIAGWGIPTLPPFSIGYVNLLMFVVVIPMTLLITPLGVKIAHQTEKRTLEIVFGLLLFLIGLRFLINLLW